MPMMRLGPFIFAVPTFAADSLSRKVSGRVEAVPVVGGSPPIHRLGPNADTLTMTATFYPFHLNGAGLAPRRGIQEATRLQIPLMLVGINGLIYGRWVLTDVGEAQSFFHPRSGTPQKVDVDISLTQYGGGGFGGLQIGFF